VVVLCAKPNTCSPRRGCPKINLQIRTSNEAAVEFYRSIGYELDDVVSMGRRLVDDEQG
jgi:hypothetical protein